MSRSEDISYGRLREAIAAGVYAPNERLIETDLAASLGVSRAVVRTALARLAQENIVERLPNRGARVRRATEKEIVELLEARMALECIAARHAALNARPADVERLSAIVAEMARDLTAEEMPTYADTNARFHNEIIRIADHAIAAALIENLHSRGAQYELNIDLQPRDPQQRLDEHRTIARAIAERDADLAEATMRRHLGGVIEGVRRRMLRRNQRPAQLSATAR